MSAQSDAIGMVNGVTINTKHFIAGVDTQNKTFAIWGDFSDTEIFKVPDAKNSPFDAMINELRGLELMIQRMLEETDDQKEDSA